MVPLKRLFGFLARCSLLVGTPLLTLLVLGIVVEVVNPGFDLRDLLTLVGLGRFLVNVLLNFTPGALAMLAIPYVASWYLDTLYDTGGRSKARTFLGRSIFGQPGAKPWLLVKGGGIAVGADSVTARVGGPGLLIVHNDSAVITEQNGQLKRVIGPGYARLERFERIWEIVDLRPQHWVYTVSALTRDGIPISCDTDVSFKIDDRVEGAPIEPDKDNKPHPFTEEAVLKAATATRIREEEREDQIMKWTGRLIIGDAEGVLRSILARYQLNQLVQPNQPSGDNSIRNEIRRQLRESLEQSAPNLGARILSVDIGKINVKVDLAEGEEQAAEQLSDKVLQQWIKTWQAELERTALIERAEGEAAMSSIEAISIQAQAEMVLTLTEAVQSLLASQEASAYQIALRFVETLYWMSFDPQARAFMPLEPLRSLQNIHEIIEQAESLPGEAPPLGDDPQQKGDER